MNLLDRMVYDTGGYTVQEILSSFCNKILEIIDLVNKNEEIVDESHTLIENIRNEVVPDLVDDIIKEMEDNGYFDRLVNVTLIENLRTELTTLLNQTITEYTTRLDNFSSKLDIITFDFSEFNECVKNGRNCNTALQNLFDEAISKGIKKLSIPKSDIILTEMLYVNGSNLEIDFNDSTIIWEGKSKYQQSMSDRTDGIINIKGKVKSTRNITSLTGKDTMKDGNYACKFTLDDKTGIKVGTYLQLEYYTNPKFSKYPSNSLNPLIEILTKVIDIDGDNVCVDYYSPFNFSNVTAVTKKCYVIEPIENVTIKNLSVLDTIEAKLPLSERGAGPYPDTNERKTFIGPIVAKHSVNCKFENIYGYNTKFPIVNMTFGYGHKCNDIICDRPSIVGSGEGYTCQSVGCMFNKLENIKCYSGRHVSDFSRSAFCEENNIYGYDMSGNSITLHGECEHDILISNSIGNLSAGHGLNYFPDMDANITYNNVKGVYQTKDSSYVKNIKFINCEIQGSVMRGNQITIENTTLRDTKGATECSRKDNNEKTYCFINNSEIYSRNTQTESDSMMWIFDDINILNSKIDYNGTNPYRRKSTVQCKSFNFTNNIMKNNRFDVRKKDNDLLRIVFNKNIINDDNPSDFKLIYFDKDLSIKLIDIIFNENIITNSDHNLTILYYNFDGFDTELLSENILAVSIRNNKLMSKSDTSTYNYTFWGGQYFRKYFFNDRDNIIEGISEGSQFSTTNNIILSNEVDA